MMTLYETNYNRVRQMFAADTMRLWLEINPFIGHKVILRETDRSSTCPWDFEVFIGGLLYGIGEIKSRNCSMQFIMENGWLIERERLRVLWKEQKERNVPACMVVHTSDDRVGYVTIDTLERHRKDLKDAPDDWLKNDNGKQAAPSKSGLICPADFIQWVN